MRLGYNTNGFTSHRLEDALTVIAGLGFRSVAISLDGHCLDPYDPGTIRQARSVGTWLAERDIVPVVETGARFLLDPWRKHWPTLLSPGERDRARRADFLARATDLAAELDAPVVSLWSGTSETDEPAAVLDARLADGLRPLCDRAAAAGVTLGFEPEPGMHIESMTDYARLRDTVAHPAFALTLDVGHAHITEPDAAETIRRFRTEIVNVHLEGMNRARHDHLLPGEGDMDLAHVVRTLAAVGYCGPANLELSRHAHMAVDAARRAKAFFTPLGLP